MSENLRNYSCKNEEIPVIGGFVLANLKKDQADFTAHSPKFDELFTTNFEAKNTEVTELVTPAEETARLKVITARLGKTMTQLRQPLNRLADYLDLAGDSIPLSASGFGIGGLRTAISKGDAESVLQNLGIINRNIARYTEILTAQGLSSETSEAFTTAAVSIQADNDEQYAIKSNRQRLVEENTELLNELYDIIRRVCKSGKAIYKGSSPAKVADYTFSKLRNEVRRQSKQQTAEEETAS